jgi:LacI family transcriptional regulator
MTIRLKDIASDLGVSIVTVSKVLRGKTDIGEETRRRVLQRVKELDYRPNMLARGLASGRTQTVGLVVPDLVHPFFAEFAKSLASVLRTREYALILASSEEIPELEEQEIRTLVRRGVDVLLLASCRVGLRRASRVCDPQIPCLLVDRNFARTKMPFVGSDDVHAGELATEHLVAIGRKRIAHIGGQSTSPSIDREIGFRNVLAIHKLRVLDSYVVRNEKIEEGGDTIGFQAMRQLLDLRTRPDAVFCYNDLTAIGAIEAVLQAGLRVPEDIAVIGCGNFRYSPYLRIPLSSVDQNTAELGRLAGEMALELSLQSGTVPHSVVLKPSLVVRQSTRRPSASP